MYLLDSNSPVDGRPVLSGIKILIYDVSSGLILLTYDKVRLHTYP